jgi:NAD(P)-dependent dehydrogenase (short-subunit alcohol dehydrogenase family)
VVAPHTPLMPKRPTALEDATAPGWEFERGVPYASNDGDEGRGILRPALGGAAVHDRGPPGLGGRRRREPAVAGRRPAGHRPGPGLLGGAQRRPPHGGHRRGTAAANRPAPSDLDRLFATVKQQQGRLDVLFANAGVPAAAPLGSITEEHFDKAFHINVKGLLFTVQRALPLFTDGGSIILNASIAASKGLEAISVYSATKAAVRSFARRWTTELRHRKIRVNVISPGYIETPIFNKAGLTREQVDEVKVSLVAATPLGRMGTPDEVANAAVFLASDDGSYVTGIELFVDGGMAQV